MALTKIEKKTRIKMRIRKKIKGTVDVPRVAVYRSNKQIYAQVIDDLNRTTLLSASSKEKEIAEKKGINKVEQAKLVGNQLAAKCKDKGIETIVFDRGGYQYHGRIKALADGAREGGLKF